MSYLQGVQVVVLPDLQKPDFELIKSGLNGGSGVAPWHGRPQKNLFLGPRPLHCDAYGDSGDVKDKSGCPAPSFWPESSLASILSPSFPRPLQMGVYQRASERASNQLCSVLPGPGPGNWQVRGSPFCPLPMAPKVKQPRPLPVPCTLYQLPPPSPQS